MCVDRGCCNTKHQLSFWPLLSKAHGASMSVRDTSWLSNRSRGNSGKGTLAKSKAAQEEAICREPGNAASLVCPGVCPSPGKPRVTCPRTLLLWLPMGRGPNILGSNLYYLPLQPELLSLPLPPTFLSMLLFITHQLQGDRFSVLYLY